MTLHPSPPAWAGTAYPPAPVIRIRVFVLANLLAAGAVVAMWLAWRILSGEATSASPPGGQAVPDALWWAGSLLLLVGVPLLFLIALVMIRWASVTRLKIGRQGIVYEEPAGVMWTAWDNVERFERVRRGFVLVEGLRLREVAHRAPAAGWQVISAFLPLFLPSALRLDGRFIPVSSLGLSWRVDGPLALDLRRHAPWLFPVEGGGDGDGRQ